MLRGVCGSNVLHRTNERTQRREDRTSSSSFIADAATRIQTLHVRKRVSLSRSNTSGIAPQPHRPIKEQVHHHLSSRNASFLVFQRAVEVSRVSSSSTSHQVDLSPSLLTIIIAFSATLSTSTPPHFLLALLLDLLLGVPLGLSVPLPLLGVPV